MKSKKFLFLVVSALLILMMSMPASAKWVKSSSGKYEWIGKKGTKLESIYFPTKSVGLVKAGSKWYARRLNGSLYKGFLTTPQGRYFMNSKGVMLKNTWFKANNKTYYVTSNGTVPKFGVYKVGKYYYGFSTYGYRMYGKRTFGSKTYFFNKTNGRMVANKTIKIGTAYYRFDANGVMLKGAEYGQYYFLKDGRMARGTWVLGKRYHGSNGIYYKGLKTINNKLYYFEPTTGILVKNETRVVSGVKYTFDANGVGKKYVAPNTGEITLANGVVVEGSYKTDPKVDDVTFLAAIIYAESGNQPVYGQCAVGTVIMNRVKSPLFPSDLREVVYQDQQFEPTRNGALTRYLKTPGLISATAKYAAQTVMQRYRAGEAKIYMNKKWIDLKDYLFFMTPAAYKRLGLKSATLPIKDHVFFKLWK